jgi:hypothetical protein
MITNTHDEMRQSTRSADRPRYYGDEECIKTFQSLLQAKQKNMAANLNVLVRNSIKSCSTKKKEVKRMRKELKPDQNYGPLSGLLKIGELCSTRKVVMIDERDDIIQEE